MFSYQGSCRSLFATALIFYQISFALSRTFLFFFFALPSLTSQLSYITISVYCLSTVFYIFFKFFKPLQNLVYSLDIIHNFTSNIQKLPDLSSSFPDNIKRRRRDLNPRAATNDLLPFQGSPFGQLGYFSKVSIKTRNLSVSAERVGFEPTRPFGQTVFKTASL